MKYKLYLLIIVALIAAGVIYASINDNNASTENLQKISSSNRYEINDKNEIILDDRNFAGKSYLIHNLTKSIIEQLKIKGDGSQVTTMYDGFGNKTETRFFTDSARLKCLIIRTSANGQKRIFVYGQNGEIKPLPANLIDRALTASVNEIADAVRIYESFKGINKPVIIQKEQTPEMPVNNNQLIQNQQIETPVLQENQTPKKTAEPVEAPPSKPETTSKEDVGNFFKQTPANKNTGEDKTMLPSN